MLKFLNAWLALLSESHVEMTTAQVWRSVRCLVNLYQTSPISYEINNGFLNNNNNNNMNTKLLSIESVRTSTLVYSTTVYAKCRLQLGLYETWNFSVLGTWSWSWRG